MKRTDLRAAFHSYQKRSASGGWLRCRQSSVSIFYIGFATMRSNKITAHNAGWPSQFRFAVSVFWSGVCEFQRSMQKR